MENKNILKSTAIFMFYIIWYCSITIAAVFILMGSVAGFTFVIWHANNQGISTISLAYFINIGFVAAILSAGGFGIKTITEILIDLKKK